MTAPRPNPRVREDWLRTRAEFEAEERAAHERRLAAARDARAREALVNAERSFPAVPVASVRARALREAYLSRAQSTGTYTNPRQFADRYGAEKASVLAFVVALGIAAVITALTFMAPYSLLATLIWLLVQLVFYAIVWLYAILVPLQNAFARRWVRHINDAFDDIAVYERWSRSVEPCNCPYINGVHDADCYGLLND